MSRRMAGIRGPVWRVRLRRPGARSFQVGHHRDPGSVRPEDNCRPPISGPERFGETVPWLPSPYPLPGPRSRPFPCGRSISEGFSANGGPLFAETRSALYDLKERPYLINIVYGLGGRDVKTEDIEKVFGRLADIAATGETQPVYTHMGQRSKEDIA